MVQLRYMTVESFDKNEKSKPIYMGLALDKFLYDYLYWRKNSKRSCNCAIGMSNLSFPRIAS